MPTPPGCDRIALRGDGFAPANPLNLFVDELRRESGPQSLGTARATLFLLTALYEEDVVAVPPKGLGRKPFAPFRLLDVCPEERRHSWRPRGWGHFRCRGGNRPLTAADRGFCAMDATFEWTARSRSACLSRPDERPNQLDESLVGPQERAERRRNLARSRADKWPLNLSILLTSGSRGQAEARINPQRMQVG